MMWVIFLARENVKEKKTFSLNYISDEVQTNSLRWDRFLWKENFHLDGQSNDFDSIKKWVEIRFQNQGKTRTFLDIFRPLDSPRLFLHFHGIHENQPLHQQRIAQGFGEFFVMVTFISPQAIYLMWKRFMRIRCRNKHKLWWHKKKQIETSMLRLAFPPFSTFRETFNVSFRIN